MRDERLKGKLKWRWRGKEMVCEFRDGSDDGGDTFTLKALGRNWSI